MDFYWLLFIVYTAVQCTQYLLDNNVFGHTNVWAPLYDPLYLLLFVAITISSTRRWIEFQRCDPDSTPGLWDLIVGFFRDIIGQPANVQATTVSFLLMFVCFLACIYISTESVWYRVLFNIALFFAEGFGFGVCTILSRFDVRWYQIFLFPISIIFTLHWNITKATRHLRNRHPIHGKPQEPQARPHRQPHLRRHLLELRQI